MIRETSSIEFLANIHVTDRQPLPAAKIAV